MSMSNRRVSYLYDPEVGSYIYGKDHIMKPQRIAVTHELVYKYGLHKDMKIYQPYIATQKDMKKFHSPDYIDFLFQMSRPELLNWETKYIVDQRKKYNIDLDSPIFAGLFDFCARYTGASLHAARLINKGKCDIAINWSGGLHHAMKEQANGFCFVNDIVICILKLLKYHNRVLYVDIDVHHGDGVQQAFYTTDRVMTVSFHKHGKVGEYQFYPMTGTMDENGELGGKHYAVNVPLKEGMSDSKYASVFQPIMQKVFEHYQPDAIVLQCGADSIGNDKLGCFNLTIKGHAKCVEYMRSFNIPMVVLGGGGYTPKNVARCWTYETAVLLDQDIPNDLPDNAYSNLFHHNDKLHYNVSQRHMDKNGQKDLDEITQTTIANLKNLTHAPSVQMADLDDDDDNED